MKMHVYYKHLEASKCVRRCIYTYICDWLFTMPINTGGLITNSLSSSGENVWIFNVSIFTMSSKITSHTPLPERRRQVMRCKAVMHGKWSYCVPHSLPINKRKKKKVNKSLCTAVKKVEEQLGARKTGCCVNLSWNRASYTEKSTFSPISRVKWTNYKMTFHSISKILNIFTLHDSGQPW